MVDCEASASPLSGQRPTASFIKGSQPIEVDGIFVAAGDRRHPRHRHLKHRVSDTILIAAIRHRVRKPPAHTERALRLSQQQQAAIGGLITAVKINCEFLAADGWKVEGKHKPLLRRMLPTHSSTHAVRPIAQPEDTRAAFGCLRRALDTSRLPSC